MAAVSVWTITLISAVSGIVGTGLGGVVSMLINCRKNSVLSFILQFSGGLMVGIVAFDLLPEAFELTSAYLVMAGLVAGFLIGVLFQEIFEKKPDKSLAKSRESKGGRLINVGLVTAAGIALHNFFEGVAVGSGFGASRGLGMSLAVVILIHDVPEGIAMAAPLIGGRVSRWKALLTTIVSGIPMAVGGFAGALLGFISPAVIAVCLAITGGTMMYISFCELLPAASGIYSGRRASIGAVVGMLLGIMVIMIFS